MARRSLPPSLQDKLRFVVDQREALVRHVERMKREGKRGLPLRVARDRYRLLSSIIHDYAEWLADRSIPDTDDADPEGVAA